MTPDEQIVKLSEQVVYLQAQLSDARAELRGIRDDAGTPLAISDGLWEFAREECGHNPSSARHALSTVIEWVQQAKVKLAEAQAEISRLNLQSEHDDEYAGILARKCDSLRDRAEKAETALAGMTSRAEKAEGRLTAARLDTERLDWLWRNGTQDETHFQVRVRLWFVGGDRAPDFRSSIDAARKREEPKLMFPLMEMHGEMDEHGECPNCANPPHEGLCHRKEPHA